MLFMKNFKKHFPEPGGGRLPILDVEEFRLDAAEQAVLTGCVPVGTDRIGEPS
jgi:hypothetical protein